MGSTDEYAKYFESGRRIGCEIELEVTKCCLSSPSSTGGILQDGYASLIQQGTELAHPPTRIGVVALLTTVAQIDGDGNDSSPLLDVIIGSTDPEE